MPIAASASSSVVVSSVFWLLKSFGPNSPALEVRGRGCCSPRSALEVLGRGCRLSRPPPCTAALVLCPRCRGGRGVPSVLVSSASCALRPVGTPSALAVGEDTSARNPRRNALDERMRRSRSRFHRAHHAHEDENEVRQEARATSCMPRITWFIWVDDENHVLDRARGMMCVPQTPEGGAWSGKQKNLMKCYAEHNPREGGANSFPTHRTAGDDERTPMF